MFITALKSLHCYQWATDTPMQAWLERHYKTLANAITAHTQAPPPPQSVHEYHYSLATAGQPLRSVKTSYMLTLGHAKKRIDPKVLKHKLAARVAAHQQAHGHSPHRKQRATYKDELAASLYQAAEFGHSHYRLWFVPATGRLFIANATPALADSLLAYLRGLTGSLPLVPFCGDYPAINTLTTCLRRPGGHLGALVAHTHALMTNKDRTYTISDDLPCYNSDNLLERGYQVERLGLRLDKSNPPPLADTTFKLDVHGAITGIKISPALLAALDNDDPEQDEAARDHAHAEYTVHLADHLANAIAQAHELASHT